MARKIRDPWRAERQIEVMEVSRSELELETIVGRIRRDELDLQPNFQRGEIWDRPRRQRLIDSLLREWYVPAVHIVRDEISQEELVLDGQQRLAAIRDFFDDEFPVDGTTEPADKKIRSLHGLTFSQLPNEVKLSLRRFALPCVTLRRYSPDEPNELFFRLNQSYNLTPSEKRNALHGVARNQVKNVVEALKDAGLLRREFVGFSNSRLAYDDIVARSCLAIEQGDLRRHINNDTVERFYREEEFSQKTIEGIETAGREIIAMGEAVDFRLRFNKATLFSWLVFCCWVGRASSRALPKTFLRDLEGDRRRFKRNEDPSDISPELLNAVSVYDDRASYRVTDVSSVIARDVSMFVYLDVRYGFGSFRGSETLVRQLASAPESRAQQLVLDFANEAGWGDLSDFRS